jgi:hypothetical protein
MLLYPHHLLVYYFHRVPISLASGSHLRSLVDDGRVDGVIMLCYQPPLDIVIVLVVVWAGLANPARVRLVLVLNHESGMPLMPFIYG